MRALTERNLIYTFYIDHFKSLYSRKLKSNLSSVRKPTNESGQFILVKKPNDKKRDLRECTE